MDFVCSDNRAAWRWLALPPQHPVTIQSLHYYISVECSAARGTLEADKWSALTWMKFECGPASAGIPARGRMENLGEEDDLRFAIILHDAAGRLVWRSRGKGVVFRTRDFEGWRSSEKARLGASASTESDFAYAPDASVGALPGESALISPPQTDAQGRPIVRALVTQANGMPPASRYLDGSGDHVNAVHLAEAARQFAALLREAPHDYPSKGEIGFSRYVEFNNPFTLTCLRHEPGAVTMEVTQGGRACTQAAYRYD